MRTSDVRSTIVSKIEAIAPDTKAHARDTFRHVDHGGRYGLSGQNQGRLPDRVFHVSLATQPTRADMLTVDAYHVDYEIAVFYSASQGVEDRIGKDFELIDRNLTRIHAEHADLFAAELTPGGVTEFEQGIESRLLARITYRLTGVS